MNITKSNEGQISVLAIEGRLDTTNYNELENAFLEIFNAEKFQVILDLSGLEYVSSSGLRVMLMALKKISTAKGTFVLSNMRDSIHEIFEISGFTTIFKIENDVNAAMKHF